MELISVIIPAYNAEKFIEKTIKSVIAQTYSNFEVIIVDDGSTDNTKQICKKLSEQDERIKLFEKKNGGVSKARNYGIEKANGEYIMFLDADDTYESTMLEKMYTKMTEENVDIVRANYYIKTVDKNISNKDRFQERKYQKEEIKKDLIPLMLEEKIRCYVWLLMIKKHFVVEFNHELHIFEDANFYLNMFSIVDSVYMLNEPLYCYNKQNESSLTKKNISKNIDNMLLANQIMKTTLKKHHIKTDENVKRLDTRILIDIVNYIYVIQYQENFKSAIKKYKEISQNETFEKMKQNYINNYASKKEKIFTEAILKRKYLLFHILCIIKNLKNKK